jgi:D-alanine-D-alanine ligase
MSAQKIQIALLYNDDSQVRNVNPQDLLAVQSTVTTTHHMHKALVGLGYPTLKIAVRNSLEELTQTLQGISPTDTLIFNNCDGFNGSNQAAALIVHLLENMGFKHTGASADAIELCIDKPRTKDCLLKYNVPTPRCQVFEQPDQEFRLDFPVIVKPAVEDGSIGITLKSVVSSPEQLCQQVKAVLETYAEPALVEEFILGQELAVAMLGNKEIEVLPITEDDYSLIDNPLERLLTYESKWDTASPSYNNILSRIPAHLTPGEEKTVQAAAVATYRAIGLRDFGRVDIRFENGIPYVIDVNELPDLAPDAGFWKSAQAAGMTYPQMIDKIIKHALQREGWIT